MRKFEIVTLRDWQRLADPVTILTGGLAVLSQLFPNIFGGSRKRLTDADYNQLIPGAGYWSTKFRNYVKTRIHYDVDFANNIQGVTLNFVGTNNEAICPKMYTFQNPPGTDPGGNGEASWTPCIQKFYEILNQESYTGGTSPVGITPGGIGATLDYSTLLPLAVGALVLVMVMKKKKRSRRK